MQYKNQKGKVSENFLEKKKQGPVALKSKNLLWT